MTDSRADFGDTSERSGVVAIMVSPRYNEWFFVLLTLPISDSSSRPARYQMP